MNGSKVTYTQPKALIEELSSVLVVDVRDDDFEGGNIANAANYRSKSFKVDESVREELVHKVIDCKVKKVVFHCMASKERGPTCARAFEATMDRVLATQFPGSDTSIEVSVLQGGYSAFSSTYLDTHPHLFANTAHHPKR